MALASSSRVLGMLERPDDLPTFPKTAAALLAATSQDSASIRTAAGIVMQDPPLAARVLRVANAPFFGLREPLTSVPQAILTLGLERVRSIVLSLTTFPLLRPREGQPGLDRITFWAHSIGTAFVARTLGAFLGWEREGEAFAAGLLHDIGMLFLDRNFQTEFTRAYERAVVEDMALAAAEEMILGTHHAEVGGHLARAWGLPAGLCDAIARHHAPDTAKTDRKFCALISLADLMTDHVGHRGIGEYSKRTVLQHQNGWILLKDDLVKATRSGMEQIDRAVMDSIRSAEQFSELITPLTQEAAGGAAKASVQVAGRAGR